MRLHSRASVGVFFPVVGTNLRGPMSQSEPVPEPDPPVCSVCLVHLHPSQEVWTCERCHVGCHLQCTLQWTLRLVTTRPRQTLPSFTCPNCRQRHPITTLPGLGQETLSERDEQGHNSTRVFEHGSIRVIARAFGLLPTRDFVVDHQPSAADSVRSHPPHPETTTTPSTVSSEPPPSTALINIGNERLRIHIQNLHVHFHTS